MKILVCGLPGGGKQQIAGPLAERLGAIYLSADQIRDHYENHDYSHVGLMEQATRLRYLADGVSLSIRDCVINFIGLSKFERKTVNADYTVWVDTQERMAAIEDLHSYHRPTVDEYDYHISKLFDDTVDELARVIKEFQIKGRL